MRIVAGKFRGTKLITPKDNSIRPTSDRVREAVFNILQHGIEDFALEDTRVLDLFAGTGALGIEALSRGARFCQFIDNVADARGTIRRNIEALHLSGIGKIWRRDATNLGSAGNIPAFDLVFIDPPYGENLGEQALLSLAKGGWLHGKAVIVWEESKAIEVPVPEGFERLDQRTYGDTQIIILRVQETL